MICSFCNGLIVEIQNKEAYGVISLAAKGWGYLSNVYVHANCLFDWLDHDWEKLLKSSRSYKDFKENKKGEHHKDPVEQTCFGLTDMCGKLIVADGLCLQCFDEYHKLIEKAKSDEIMDDYK
jgi:hypothetical protein